MLAQDVIELYREIYEIERELVGLSPDERASNRHNSIWPIFEEIIEVAAQEVDRKSILARAINYFLVRREELLRFIDRGDVEINNNSLKNQMHKIALLRKNALFAGIKMGAKTWMAFASLVAVCDLNGVDLWKHFQWMFRRIEARRPLGCYSELLPWKCPHRPR